MTILKKQLVWITFFLFLSSGFSFSKKIGIPYGILKPYRMKVAKNYIYFSDQYYISTFDKASLILIKKIGGKGQSPQEFQTEPSIVVLPNGIMTYNVFKAIFYSNTGQFFKETKINANLAIINLDTAKDNYIGSVSTFAVGNQKYHLSSFDIFDPHFKKIKTIHSFKDVAAQPQKKVQKLIIQPINLFHCFDNKIFVAKDNRGDFILDVFDYQGTHLYSITRNYQKIKIPDEYKKTKLEEFKNTPARKKRWAILITMFDYTFPEYFPPIQDFTVTDGKIYIKTYKYQKTNVEYLVLDLKGNFQGRYFLPDTDRHLSDISNNYLFYLVDNNEQEEWEIHGLKIQ